MGRRSSSRDTDLNINRDAEWNTRTLKKRLLSLAMTTCLEKNRLADRFFVLLNFIFDAKLRFALLASLRSAIFGGVKVDN